MNSARILTVTAMNISLALTACAQQPAPPASSVPPPSSSAPPPSAAPPPSQTGTTVSTSSVPSPSGKTFSQAELEQLVAPIALYPDALFTQILMASTYPLDVVQADRWAKANSKLKGKELEDALQKQPWDPSVKSLTVVPQVLTMMSEKIDWTQKLGDAFLAQEKDVMATAQALRKKALDQGNLKDSKEQKVVTEQAGSTTVIKIEPTNPEVVYVPAYNPTYVYGAWPYPAYPPYYYTYPGYAYPGYAAGAAFVGFTFGAIVGGALWGGANWGAGSVNVNVNRYNNFNRTNLQNSNWSHNAQRRGAVPYRDQGVAQRYGRGQSANAASREQFRGRNDAGRADAGRGSTQRANAGGSNLSSRDAGSSRNSSAFDTSRGSQARDASSRGSSSLNSARSSGNFGGGARSSGFSGGGGRSFGGGGGGFRGGGGRR